MFAFPGSFIKQGISGSIAARSLLDHQPLFTSEVCVLKEQAAGQLNSNDDMAFSLFKNKCSKETGWRAISIYPDMSAFLSTVKISRRPQISMVCSPSSAQSEHLSACF